MRLRQARAGVSSLRLLCALAALLGASALAPAAASAALEHPFLGSFGTANKPTFTDAQGLAVDQASGDLLVVDRGVKTLSRFKPDGTPDPFSALGTNVIGGFSFDEFSTKESGYEQVAVDNSGGETDGNIYVADFLGGVVDIFGEDGSPLGQLTESSEGHFNRPCGVAVDPSGNVYAADSTEVVHKYEPAANPPVNADNGPGDNFATGSSQCNLAAGRASSAGFIFSTHPGIPSFNLPGSVVKLDSSTGTQEYDVDTSDNHVISVNPANGHLFVSSGSEVKEFDASGAANATPLTPIRKGGGQVSALAVDATTGNIYAARQGNPNIEVWGPATLLPSATTEAATTNGTIFTLHGIVGADAAPPATCVFQYVEVHAKGFAGATSIPCSPAGPFTGTATEAVSAEIGPLPEANYRFRLLASNENGDKDGGTLFFSTIAEAGLPDGRAYEMVSPPQKGGEVIAPEPVGLLGSSCSQCLPGANSQLMPMQSAQGGGDSVLFLGQPFSSGLAAGLNEYLADRGSSGWATQSLSAPTITGTYEAFSSDLSRGVLAQVEPTLSPQAPTRGGQGFANLYLRQGSALQPLVTEEPPQRDPGIHSQFGNQFEVLLAGANAGTSSEAAFGHLIFEANDALTGEVAGIAPKAPEISELDAGENCSFPGANCNLYEWVSGQLKLVNVLPGNASTAVNAVVGSGRLLKQPGAGAPNVDHAVSSDGSHVFWSEEGSGQIYVRIAGEETLEVPGPGTCKQSVSLKERVCFLTAAADGSAVLLSDGKIYEPNEAGDAYEQTVDLTENEAGESKGGFRGVLGAAEDFSRIYFVDTAALSDENEVNANEEHAEAGKLNLYVWDGGDTKFIGALVPSDNGFLLEEEDEEIGNSSRYGDWKTSRSSRTAQVSPDGSYLAFMSKVPLTGYDNTLSDGGPCTKPGTSACYEVFEYSVSSESLTCVSCNPTGQQPLGESNLTLIIPDDETPSFPQPHNLSVGGRLFFESQDALVPRDRNGFLELVAGEVRRRSRQDVYQWEPEGIGSCNRAGGCVSLISSGQSPNDSMFLDSTPSGNDAFFITREQLVPSDRDEQLDLYDARVGGGIEEALSPPCRGEACKGPGTVAPAQPGPGSASFNGPSNRKQKPGRKHKKQKHKHKRHHKRAAKHNSGGRR